ncbi:MAG TPA: ATP-grasp domain-containing protein, partial [Gemmatimonadales bacterium]|nr:ATP-grasp domain-containing protein [Gemmatimonadales bacterium]
MTEARRGHVLVAGVTTRALAISAARAGYRVTAIDAFGDLDLQAAADVIVLRPEPGTRFTPFEAAGAAEAVTADFAAYTSNFENYPDAVARLAQGRRLLGNPPDVLVQVRNPIGLMRMLRRRGFATPRTRAAAGTAPGTWLLKPRRSGGGHGTTVWRRGWPVPRSRYLQERIDGAPGSVVFAADGRDAVPLALTRQLVADPNFGAHGFRYCGSMLGSPSSLFPHGEKLLEIAAALASSVTREFGLVGLNGIDFMAREGVPYPIEVNPRFSGSMELVERIHDLPMFELHVRACNQALPMAAPLGGGVEGKAIVFARRDVRLGDTRGWM